LAERFTHFVGEPPMQYLTRWRMQAAARLLADGRAKVSAVGLQVGYDSEAAFSRAFKKAAGVPPAAWRSRYAPPVPAAARSSPATPPG
jgi:AraC-like DNA-binding protein